MDQLAIQSERRIIEEEMLCLANIRSNNLKNIRIFFRLGRMNDFWSKKSDRDKVFGREDSNRAGRSERKDNRENAKT